MRKLTNITQEACERFIAALLPDTGGRIPVSHALENAEQDIERINVIATESETVAYGEDGSPHVIAQNVVIRIKAHRESEEADTFIPALIGRLNSGRADFQAVADALDEPYNNLTIIEVTHPAAEEEPDPSDGFITRQITAVVTTQPIFIETEG